MNSPTRFDLARTIAIGGAVLALLASIATTSSAVPPKKKPLIPAVTSVSLSGTYTQDFNLLSKTGQTNAKSTLPTGWDFNEVNTGGSGADATYATTAGAATGADTYSYGTVNDADRALGELTGLITSTIGASFTNNTGNTIQQLAIAYTGEQWRRANGGADKLDFQYSTDATGLTDGTWTNVDALDFNAPNTSGATGALDGNASGNRTAISSTITGLSIANGATFWIRWVPFRTATNDQGLAVDDFSMTPSVPIELSRFAVE